MRILEFYMDEETTRKRTCPSPAAAAAAATAVYAPKLATITSFQISIH